MATLIERLKDADAKAINGDITFDALAALCAEAADELAGVTQRLADAIGERNRACSALVAIRSENEKLLGNLKTHGFADGPKYAPAHNVR